MPPGAIPPLIMRYSATSVPIHAALPRAIDRLPADARGTRLEETEKRIAAIQQAIREVIPPAEIDTMLDVLGTPYSGINLSLSEGALISPADGQILIALADGHRPTAGHVRALRERLASRPASPATSAS